MAAPVARMNSFLAPCRKKARGVFV